MIYLLELYSLLIYNLVTFTCLWSSQSIQQQSYMALYFPSNIALCWTKSLLPHQSCMDQPLDQIAVNPWKQPTDDEFLLAGIAINVIDMSVAVYSLPSVA